MTQLLYCYNLGHLWGNMIVQLVYGVFLERVHGWKRILASVIGGSLAISAVFTTNYCDGASGGTYGLNFAYIVNILLVIYLWLFTSFILFTLLIFGCYFLELDCSEEELLPSVLAFAIHLLFSWSTLINPQIFKFYKNERKAKPSF